MSELLDLRKEDGSRKGETKERELESLPNGAPLPAAPLP